MVLDGPFGNHPAVHMVRGCGLHLISKLRPFIGREANQITEESLEQSFHGVPP